MRPPPPFPQHPVLSWYQGKTFEDLGPVDIGGHLYFPETIKRMTPRGLEELPVRIRVPTRTDRARARMEVMRHIVKNYSREMGSDPTLWTLDRARAIVGAEFFDDLDTYAIVAQCTFEPEDVASGKSGAPVHFMMLDVLLDSYLAPSVIELYEKMSCLGLLLDHRAVDLTDEDYLALVAAIGRARNTTPLAVMDGATLSAFVVRLACDHPSCRPSSSPTASPGTSTPAS